MSSPSSPGSSSSPNGGGAWQSPWSLDDEDDLIFHTPKSPILPKMEPSRAMPPPWNEPLKELTAPPPASKSPEPLVFAPPPVPVSAPAPPVSPIVPAAEKPKPKPIDTPTAPPIEKPPPPSKAPEPRPAAPRGGPLPFRAAPTVAPQPAEVAMPRPLPKFEEPPQPKARPVGPAKAARPRQDPVVAANARRIFRLAWLALSTLAFLLAAQVYLTDEDPPLDNDLMPTISMPALGASQTPRAPELLRLALHHAIPIDVPNLAAEDPWTWDTPTLARAVQSNGQSLENLRDLLSEQDWQPAHSAWLAEDFASLRGWNDLMLAKVAAAVLFHRSGDEGAGLQSALDLAVLGRRMQEIMAWPTSYSCGVELHQRACETMVELLRNTHLAPRALQVYQAAFQHLAPSDDLLMRCLDHWYRYERSVILGRNMMVEADQALPALPKARYSRLFFKPNATLTLIARSFQSFKAELAKQPYARLGDPTRIVGPEGAPMRVWGEPNSRGMEHANHRLWQYANLLERQGLQVTHHLMVETFFAVQRFAMEQHRLPITLMDLVPTYAPDVPVDPECGQALGYDPDRGWLFSAGLDGRIGGGEESTKPLGLASEPTIRLRN